jgi:uncharacterized membrane-anchored protein YjiN (DUF445 family)
MRIEFSWEINDEDLVAIASHLGKTTADDDDVRRFLNEAIADALENVMVEYEAAMNDPSTYDLQ